MFKCRISGVRKKKEIERRVPEKNQSILGLEILLSSCSLVGLCIRLQVKVTGKMMKICKVFFVWVFEGKIAIC